MAGSGDERTVHAAFAEFHEVGLPYLRPPGVVDVRVRVRRRRVVRQSALTGLAGVLVVVAALSVPALVRRPAPVYLAGAVPPADSPTTAVPTPSGPATPTAATDPATSPTTGRSTVAAPSGGASTPRGAGSAEPPADTADISVSSTYLEFGPGDAESRSGTLFVMLDNAGPAAATGLSLVVAAPSNVEPSGSAGGCRLSGSAGTYRCTTGPLAAGATAKLRFDFTAPPGEVAPGPASVTVRDDHRRS